MNQIGTGTFDDVMAAAIDADVLSLLTDAVTSVSVTFFTPTGSSMDYATGTVSRSGDQDTVTGWWSPLTEREAGESDAYRVGDCRLLAPQSSFTRAPNTDSNLSLSDALYSVVGVETAFIGSASYYEVICRPSTES